jgi:hypothetical protein
LHLRNEVARRVESDHHRSHAQSILVNCVPSGEMRNHCTLHIMKENFENFLIHWCNCILLSQVHCVWQVVKTPTIIFNNPVYIKRRLLTIMCPNRAAVFCGGAVSLSFESIRAVRLCRGVKDPCWGESTWSCSFSVCGIFVVWALALLFYILPKGPKFVIPRPCTLFLFANEISHLSKTPLPPPQYPFV